MAGARHYSELVAWQLADELRQLVFALTNRPGFARDLKAAGQTDDAVNSICRNIAEGFGCESHKEFARYLEIARRSLNELLDELRGAELKGYVSTADLTPIRTLSRRLYPAINSLWSYLKRTPDWKRPGPPGTNQGARKRHRRASAP
jgi:four helix bundle protein